MKSIPTVKGANLGNWLVLEKWMSPSMFDGTDAEDEYYLARTLSPEVYAERIRRHRQEYITEHDFAFLAKCGFNAVRIPIPFSIFGDRPPYVSGIEYLDSAFDWGEKWAIQILIDLHTVPGSQNGFDNGGLCGVCKWAESPLEVAFALDLLEKIAKRYGHRDSLFGIQPLNEPITDALVGNEKWEDTWTAKSYPAKDPELVKGSAPIKMSFLRGFYVDAYRRIMPHMAEGKYFVFHDAFRTITWKDFMQEPEFKNVVLDTHFYLSNAEIGGCPKHPDAYIGVLQGHFRNLITEMQNYFPTITGEWCIANGYLNEVTDPSEADRVATLLAKEQKETWEVGSGSFYWNYKMLIDDPQKEYWDLKKCILHGWFPANN